MSRICIVLSLLFLYFATSASAHNGPDPLAHWIFDQRHLADGKLTAQVGPDAKFDGAARIVKDELGESIAFSGRTQCVIAEDSRDVNDSLPGKAMTVSAWVAIDAPTKWGGIVGVIQDNGNAEAGWVLGYNQSVFYFGLATTGADDGDGLMTYLKGATKYEVGKLYHVVAVYDGETAELYVNGQLDASTTAQSGDVLYPKSAPFVIGCYRDADEHWPLSGRIREVRIYDVAAKAAGVKHEFDHNKRLAELDAQFSISNEFVIDPYLQFGTRNGMTVMWRTSRPSKSTVRYGETVQCEQNVSNDELVSIHELRIEELQPETQYFYLVESESNDGSVTASKPRTFTTAVNRDTPFAFAVISDTQGNPEVSGKIAEMAWGQRPSFVLHPGDLVSTGTNDGHWTQHFFPGMRPLIDHVPFYSVLGNHELNAKNYFDYVSLPDPEFHYQFDYGNSEFFMIDSNRNVGPDSEQYQWLDKQLAKSEATWKIVCHHHPPYSSDENDYGNLWKTNKSTRGDTKARQLVTLYEKHGVDIVWNGHIHSYERTWPVRENKSVEEEGVIYMITGGGGGGLETAGPYRPFFQNNVKHGHHYCLVAVNGGTFEIKSFDLEGRLFDHLVIKKDSSR